jgi:hypothetical protein
MLDACDPALQAELAQQVELPARCPASPALPAFLIALPKGLWQR